MTPLKNTTDVGEYRPNDVPIPKAYNVNGDMNNHTIGRSVADFLETYFPEPPRDVRDRTAMLNGAQSLIGSFNQMTRAVKVGNKEDADILRQKTQALMDKLRVRYNSGKNVLALEYNQNVDIISQMLNKKLQKKVPVKVGKRKNK
jgi:hypothetical protein